MNFSSFLPVSRDDMRSRDWYYYDFLLISGDAYVDHPSFGAAVISRILEAEGYRVAILAQPGWGDSSRIEEMGCPRYGVLITAGNLDSMVAHYTAAKKPRSEDFYSPGKKTGLRPDRAVTVYSKLARAAFPDTPIVIGGLEASLRRFAHYDYWDDAVHRPILFDSDADIVVYGMGETATIEVAQRLAAGKCVESINDVRGTGYVTASSDVSAKLSFEHVTCASYDSVKKDKRAYAKAVKAQYDEHDPVRGRAVIQHCGGHALVINPPAQVLTSKQLDRIYDLPYTRNVHPMYEKLNGVPAIEEVRFSITHTRGCFGACNFCALSFHQGRMVTSRSHDSVLREVAELTHRADFKGYIHDVGGPTANFRQPSCQQQLKLGMCKDENCLIPQPCKKLSVNHKDYLLLLRKIAEIPGVKKVFVRSGIRFDYLLYDKDGEFFTQLIKNHISGQLKVAPEHCVGEVLQYMGKPDYQVFERFEEKFKKLNERYGLKQFLVAYLMSSHPGSTIKNAVSLAEYLHRKGRHPQQVQDFYPTPGTISTCMYYTGLDPRTMKPVYVPRSAHEKAMQRALLQWKNPKNRALCREALRLAGREDLIGYSMRCLVHPNGKSGKSQNRAKR